MSYDLAVEKTMSQRVNAPCFVIFANREDSVNSKYEKGIVIAKGRSNSTDYTNILPYINSETWFIAQTNMDVWKEEVHDFRYEKVLK